MPFRIVEDSKFPSPDYYRNAYHTEVSNNKALREQAADLEKRNEELEARCKRLEGALRETRGCLYDVYYSSLEVLQAPANMSDSWVWSTKTTLKRADEALRGEPGDG